MKKLSGSTAVLMLLLNTPSYADPTVMLGFGLNFGGSEAPALGLTAKVLSSNRADRFVAAVGGTYFFDGTWGIDAGLGRTLDNSAITLTYDFINKRPQVAVGWADIESVC